MMDFYKISFQTNGFTLAPGEYLLQCPYKTAHQITNKRLLHHLTKCRLSYLSEFKMSEETCDVVICRWNSIHHVQRSEAREHEATCPSAIEALGLLPTFSRVKKEEEIQIELPTKKERKFMKHPSQETPSVFDEEDWEKDSGGYTGAYDPSVKLKSQPIFHIPGGLKPAEKRAYRKKQVEFFAEYQKNKEGIAKTEHGKTKEPATTVGKQEKVQVT